MHTAAIITARAGSTRLPDKHFADVCGLPLLSYPLRAALAAETVDTTVLATDCPQMAEYAARLGCHVVMLPPAHTRPESTQHEALAYAVSRLDAEDPGLEAVVCLLGNTVMVDGATIDAAVRLLADRPDASSVLTVWQAEDDHPFRALEEGDGGYLRPLRRDSPQWNDTRAYPPCYYHDQGVWAVRKENFYRALGPPPWTWVGDKPLPLVRPWWAGRDVDDAHDLTLHRLYVREGMRDRPKGEG